MMARGKPVWEQLLALALRGEQFLELLFGDLLAPRDCENLQALSDEFLAKCRAVENAVNIPHVQKDVGSLGMVGREDDCR